jgi:hypothetical protein
LAGPRRNKASRTPTIRNAGRAGNALMGGGLSERLLSWLGAPVETCERQFT